jgi:dTMP kinase
MAYLLAIEGADGAGKGTVSAALVAYLDAAGRSAALVSFPRYTETIGGFAIGAFLAGRAPQPSPRAAATLYALDRFESRAHLADLAAAHDVLVFDRHLASNMAYQAARVPAEEAPALMAWVRALEVDQFGLVPPDRSVFLDTPAAVSRRFIAQKQQRSYTDRAYDEYEADDALQSRVRANYRTLAAADPTGWQVVATTVDSEPRAPADIAAEIADDLP